MKEAPISEDLILKYNQPVPRYTSYPTVPFWNSDMTPAQWEQAFSAAFNLRNHTEGISLYVHLPFCEQLCTYCGCNKRITTNHNVEEEYIKALEKEWMLYRKLMHQTPVIRQMHLGGGTPTFFSPKNLDRIIGMLLKNTIKHPKPEFSIEGHPNNTTSAHLEVLYKHGFRRISYGVQDLDPEIQRIINRIQPVEVVQLATTRARVAGFESVNFDLIYGLPRQTIETMRNTIAEVIRMQPDRIAFYSYAHVPWTSRGQRLFDESDLPNATEKLSLYQLGKNMLLEAGYVDIGMDHFAMPHDALFKARKDKTLYRNFMGYTASNPGMLIGLGVSAISDIGTAYAQNEKALSEYYALVNQNILPITRGYLLNEEDLFIKAYIIEISCRGETTFDQSHLDILKKYSFPVLEEMQADGLVKFDDHALVVTPAGHHFIRNICSAFDLRLQASKEQPDKNVMFSKSI